MTLTPNTQITKDNVWLLKAGDWLLRRDGRLTRLDLVFDKGLSGVYADGSTHSNSPCSYFTYIGPDLGDGWIGWSGGENPVPGMTVRWKARDGVSGESYCAWGWEWSATDPDRDIIAFRPALSPPAEGVTRPLDAHCECFGDTGFQSSTHHDAGGNERCDLCGGLVRTPTPAPVELNTSAGPVNETAKSEHVDWERVGPKLVEAVEKARDHYDMMTRLANGGVVYEVNPDTRKRIRRKLSEVIATEADAGSKHCRAALAATQPQSNGE